MTEVGLLIEDPQDLTLHLTAYFENHLSDPKNEELMTYMIKGDLPIFDSHELFRQ